MILTKKTNQASFSLDLDGGQVMWWGVVSEKGNLNVLYQGSEKKRTGIPILFPFADPLPNNIFKFSNEAIPQHGFARHQSFKLVDEFENGYKIKLTYNDLDEIWKKAFPFKFELYIVIKIEDFKLRYSFELKNLSDMDLPIAPGLHPYFKINHANKAKFQLPALDTDNITWDSFDKSIFVDFLNGSEAHFGEYKIRFYSSINKPDHLVVWTQNNHKPDSNFICVEPFFRETNGIHTDPILVHPNSNWSWDMDFEIIVV